VDLNCDAPRRHPERDFVDFLAAMLGLALQPGAQKA
jgi:hypothetical protein